MKKAFSLIELLIVIVIIGVVYTLSVGSFKKVKDESKKLSLQNLKIYLQNIPHDRSVELLCLDDCFSCDVLVDGKKLNEIDDFLDKSVRVYRYDFSYGIVELEKDNDICFSFSVDKKGIGEQVFVEFKEKVYDFSTYLSPTPVYDSISDAIDAKESLVREVLR